MNSTGTTKLRRQSLFLAFNVIWVSVFYVAIINRSYPYVGHDYGYFVSRLFDTYLHYRINGFSIQWYTPSFGGGLPAYANPQHMQFSLLQLLCVFVSPWVAVNLAISINLVVGLVCFYFFCKNSMGLDWRAALLGTLFQNLTGFYLGHLISGQLGFMGFPLLSSLLLALFSTRCTRLESAVVISFVSASLLYSAGFYTLVIFALSLSMTLPLVFLCQTRSTQHREVFLRVLVALPLFLGLCASKLYAVQSFMRYFPRAISYQYSVDYTDSLILPVVSFFAEIMGSAILAPVFVCLGQDVTQVSKFLSALSGYPYSSIWETDNSLSPVLLAILTIGLVHALFLLRSGKVCVFAKSRFVALLVGLLAGWFCVEFTLARGFLYAFVKSLPIASSLHIHMRFMAAFFLPLSVGGAFLIDRWLKTRGRCAGLLFFSSINVLVLLFPFAYLLYPSDLHDRRFNVETILRAYEKNRGGDVLPVTGIASSSVRDWEAFEWGLSTSKPYEPIFGYGLEAFRPQVVPGLASELNGGRFNMTNPASINFPEYFASDPTQGIFQRFSKEDQDSLLRFLNRQQPEWPIPHGQRLANGFSFLIVVVSLVLLCYDRLRRITSIS